MKRAGLLAFLLVPSLLAAGEPAGKAAKPPEKVLLAPQFREGDRFAVSLQVSTDVRRKEKQGDRETVSSESVQRTERFVDLVTTPGEAGLLEIERSYLTLYTKVKGGEEERPTVFRSPLSGRSVTLREQGRRRDVTLKGRGSLDALTQKTAGVEIDWRDILSDRPVGPGDEWEAECDGLAKRVAALLSCGHSRSAMRVRFEERAKRFDRDCVRLYVDWTIEGMRDLQLFSKVTLAGDAWFDLGYGRFVDIDLVGTIGVQGAIVGRGPARIIRGEGPVSLKTVVRRSEVEAAVEKEGE